MTVRQLCTSDDFSLAILQMLLGNIGPSGVSVPRLGKALGSSASVVMRQLTSMGDVCGRGWVSVQADGDRFMVQLTDAGRLAAQAAVSQQ